jgi:hypothetical protein
MKSWTLIRSVATGLALGLLLAACATIAPPSEAIATADLAIQKADQAGATQSSPLEMRIARESLQEARSKSNDDDTWTEARRLAEKASVQAQLAEAKAIEARIVRNRDETQKSIDVLREQISAAK